MSVLPARMYVHLCSAMPVEVRRVLQIPLELDLLTVVNCHVVLGIGPMSSARTVSAPNHGAISTSPEFNTPYQQRVVAHPVRLALGSQDCCKLRQAMGQYDSSVDKDTSHSSLET